MNERRFALPTLLAALCFLGVTVLWTDVSTDDASSPLAAKLDAAERIIVYAVTPTTGPSFRLVGGGTETILLIAHLQLPPDQPYVPDRTYRFDIVITLRAPDGSALHTWTVSKRTRQTKAGPLGDNTWAYEAAFVPDGRLRLSDGGGIELDLPECPPDAMLEVRMAEEAGVLAARGSEIVTPFASPTALVRLYRRIAVDPAARARALADKVGSHTLGGATYLPWHSLRSDQQLRYLEHAWERLASEGLNGADYRIHSIYIAASGPPEAPELIAPPIEISAEQPALVHLQGPGIVVVRARLAAPSDTAANLELRARWLGSMNAAEGDDPDATFPETLRSLALPGSGEWQELAVPVPVGWTALALHGDASRIEAHVLADDVARHAGPDRHEQHRDSDLRPFVPVDSYTYHLYSAGPTTPPLSVTLTRPFDIYSRILKISARAEGAPRPLPLRVDFIDAEGRSVATFDKVLQPIGPAPFDRLSRAYPILSSVIEESDRDIETGRRRAGFPLGDSLVSESVSLRVIAPPEAVTARVSALAPALLGFYGQLPPPAEATSDTPWIAPYDQITSRDERWRNVPQRHPRWFSLRAEDHADRLAIGEVKLLHGQVRRTPIRRGYVEPMALDPSLVMGEAPSVRPPSASSSGGPWRTEHPYGSHMRINLLERVSAARRSDALARWGPGLYTGIARGASVQLDLGASQRAPQIYYQVTSASTAAIGETLSFKTDGVEETWKITGRTDKRALAKTQGRATLSWGTGPAGVMLLVDREPLSSAPIYEHRQLHHLGQRGLSLRVDKPANGSLVVNVVLHWLDGAPKTASEVKIRIDDGKPSRLSAIPLDRITEASRRLAAAPSDVTDVLFADRRGEARVHTQRATITLGDDIAPGRHVLHLELVRGPPVWVRFFRHGAPRPAPSTWQWNERRPSAIVEDIDENDE